MARSQSPKADPGTKAPADDAGWARLTWSDLEDWAGSRSVSRGRAYQRGGRVKDLKISRDGELLATVVGGDRYATRVALKPGGKRPSLESSCTCPVGVHCKHAVAVVAEYLQALAEGRSVPAASDDDPRWDDLDREGPEFDDESDEDEEDEPWDWDDDEEDAPPHPRPRGRKRAGRRAASQAGWDEKIERHLRAKTQSELADLVWSLARRFPEIYQEFRERIALQEGDVGRLLAEARREIRRVTSEAAWRDSWSDEGHIPDYSKIRHRFERLLELGHADEVVSLGREFIREGMRQVGAAHDEEGETAEAFGKCLPVVFQAVLRSSLPGPERLLFAIDAELADDYDVIGEASEAVFDACSRPEDWSAVADVLAQRLKATPAPGEARDDDFFRNYQRDRVVDWMATALREAGREAELQAVYEAEARATGSYERLVNYLLEARRYEDAERWAREGIAATRAKFPGIASHLASSLCELARKRKQWDVVAAHAAHKFFSDYPSPTGFDELVKAAGKAGVEGPVRAAALRFLETGVTPYEAVAPRTAAGGAAGKSSARKAAASRRSAAPPPEPTPAAPTRVQIDPAWPLPVPDYLIPLLDRPGRYGSGPHPHLDVLLEMAIAAKRPDEVLRWFDKMRSAPRVPGAWDSSPAYADRVAAAVAAAHPQRALEIYLAALNAQLPHAQQSAYENAAGCLRKLRPLYEKLGRAGEWAALLASIREKYRNRPRFMELLDGVEGRTIVQSARSRRK